MHGEPVGARVGPSFREKSPLDLNSLKVYLRPALRALRPALGGSGGVFAALGAFHDFREGICIVQGVAYAFPKASVQYVWS